MCKAVRSIPEKSQGEGGGREQVRQREEEQTEYQAANNCNTPQHIQHNTSTPHLHAFQSSCCANVSVTGLQRAVWLPFKPGGWVGRQWRVAWRAHSDSPAEGACIGSCGPHSRSSIVSPPRARMAEANSRCLVCEECEAATCRRGKREREKARGRNHEKAARWVCFRRAIGENAAFLNESNRDLTTQSATRTHQRQLFLRSGGQQVKASGGATGHKARCWKELGSCRSVMKTRGCRRVPREKQQQCDGAGAGAEVSSVMMIPSNFQPVSDRHRPRAQPRT